MKLTYETAVATFIQFIVASLFILLTQIGSSVVTCFKDSSNCISNLLTSLIFFLLIAITFGTIWIIGFAAQERRSRRLAQLLICAEGGIGLIGLFSLKLNIRTFNLLGLIASLGVTILAAWIIFLAFRLMRAGGGRVVVRGRRRRRP